MRRTLGAIGNIAATGLVLAGVAGLAAAGWWWPPSDARVAAAIDVAVAAGPVELVCAGPPRVAGSDAGLDYDPGFDPLPEGLTTSVTLVSLARESGVAATGRWLPDLAGAATGEAREGEVLLAPEGAASSSAVVSEPTGPSVLRAEPVFGEAALAAGATLSRANAGDLRGLAAARCLPAVTSAWLVGGTTELGASASLVLVNPGATPATVTLDVWGATGPITSGLAGTVLVPAQSEEVVLLESIAADEPRLAVHLTVSGGAVAPYLQDSRLRGLVPAGMDLVEPAVEPSSRVVVPGVVLEESTIDALDPAVLQVVNPGDAPATVRLRLLGPDGPLTVPGAETRVVDAGTVGVISLAGVRAGTYAAELTSDLPVTAAAMLTRVGTPGADDPDQPVVDRAWVAAAPTLAEAVLVLPSDGTSALAALANPSDSALDLRVRAVLPDGAVGDPLEVSVPAGGAVVVDGARLTGALAVEVEVATTVTAEADGPPGGVVGAVVSLADASDGPLVAAIGAQEDLATERTVTVRLPNR